MNGLRDPALLGIDLGRVERDLEEMKRKVRSLQDQLEDAMSEISELQREVALLKSKNN